MSETILNIIKISVKVTIFTGVVLALLAFMAYVFSILTLITNTSVLGDITSLVQMWLPFNLNVIMVWVITASGLYLTFNLARFALTYTNKFLQ